MRTRLPAEVDGIPVRCPEDACARQMFDLIDLPGGEECGCSDRASWPVPPVYNDLDLNLVY